MNAIEHMTFPSAAEQEARVNLPACYHLAAHTRWTPLKTSLFTAFVIHCGCVICGERMTRGQLGFWDLDERYERLRTVGDTLKKLNAIIPWPVFEKPLAKALKRSDGSKGDDRRSRQS
jgi:hypothetical protein